MAQEDVAQGGVSCAVHLPGGLSNKGVSTAGAGEGWVKRDYYVGSYGWRFTAILWKEEHGYGSEDKVCTAMAPAAMLGPSRGTNAAYTA
eukprot:44121-Chlamydomonas_euryale.AAC.2